MIDAGAVDAARLQFAVTALYHFIFVPLTLGLSFILVAMELTYVLSGKQIYKDMTKFWGKLFGINFALGVTTGITMEFQFGTNWAYYSHYVGDIFGAPLAIEGLMAFFLESTMIGLFFFGWDRLSKGQHLLVTALLAVASNLSALLILIANGWMQNPVGSEFNPITMRMELISFSEILFNPVAQSKFVHTVSAGYVTGSVFVLAISAWYLLKGKHVEFAKRSIRIASAFGLASALSVVVLGDESGYAVGEFQQAKLAAMEGMWETEPAPASFNLLAWPNEAAQKNDWAIHIPYAMGLIATRSTDTVLPGIREIRERNVARVESGVKGVLALEAYKKDQGNAEAKSIMLQHKDDLGYGLLVKKYASDLNQATPEMIRQAAHDTVPKVTPLFYGFRIMVGLGFTFIAMFIYAFWASANNVIHEKKGFLRFAVWMLPAPWVATSLGWIVAEYGRQPWTVTGILPTHLSASSVSAGEVWASLAGFVLFYTGLMIVEMYLMIKYARLGPTVLTEQVK
ncbi:MAG: cytochrome ubiquinol oxidase subunit I [Burkholderiaceae bacterium]